MGIPYVFLTNGAEVLFWEWERDAYPHPVKTFFKQDDLERRFASLQLRRDVLNVPIDLKIAGRDYQQECIQTASKEIKQGRRKLLLEMATGTGKTRTAGVFATQAKKVSGERWMWVVSFCASIGWLIFVAYSVISGTPESGMSGNSTPVFDPNNLLRGLPFAAPAIWLGWFSARQIGILARIQQDYAYKASTAVAFEGYKKEVASANDEALSNSTLSDSSAVI